MRSEPAGARPDMFMRAYGCTHAHALSLYLGLKQEGDKGRKTDVCFAQGRVLVEARCLYAAYLPGSLHGVCGACKKGVRIHTQQCARARSGSRTGRRLYMRASPEATASSSTSVNRAVLVSAIWGERERAETPPGPIRSRKERV